MCAFSTQRNVMGINYVKISVPLVQGIHAPMRPTFITKSAFTKEMFVSIKLEKQNTKQSRNKAISSACSLGNGDTPVVAILQRKYSGELSCANYKDYHKRNCSKRILLQ